MNWIKIDGTLVNLDNVLAVQNRDELGHDYEGLGWMRVLVAVYNPIVGDMDYIYFEDKPCVRKAYEYLLSKCTRVFEDKKVPSNE
jgi:hypothetical protein